MIRIFSQYVSAKSVLLAVLESVLIASALVCGARVRFWNDAVGFVDYVQAPGFTFQVLLAVAVFQMCLYHGRHYSLGAYRTRAERFLALAQSLGFACLVLGVMYYVAPWLLIGRGVFFIGTALVAAFLTVNRAIVDRAWQMAGPRQRVAIVGTKDLAVTVAREFAKRGDLNIEVAGFIEPERDGCHHGELFGRPVLGGAQDLAEITQRGQISRLVVAMEDRRGLLPVRDLVSLRVQGVQVEEAHSTMSSLTGRVRLETVRPSWFVFSGGSHRSPLTLFFKRVLDVGFAALGLVLSAPAMALTALAVKLDSPGPVLFRQAREGYRGRTFEVLKFRSMRADAENGGAQWAQKDDPRVTRLGRFLRTYRLDELPQFINVLRGEMSFVGPRPERPVFVDLLRNEISYYDERHSVRPGLTGWAQIRYPYGSSVEDAFRKLEYDLFYLKNMSVLFDCAIVFETVRTVLTGRGAR